MVDCLLFVRCFVCVLIVCVFFVCLFVVGGLVVVFCWWYCLRCLCFIKDLTLC